MAVQCVTGHSKANLNAFAGVADASIYDADYRHQVVDPDRRTAVSRHDRIPLLRITVELQLVPAHEPGDRAIRPAAWTSAAAREAIDPVSMTTHTDRGHERRRTGTDRQRRRILLRHDLEDGDVITGWLLGDKDPGRRPPWFRQERKRELQGWRSRARHDEVSARHDVTRGDQNARAHALTGDAHEPRWRICKLCDWLGCHWSTSASLRKVMCTLKCPSTEDLATITPASPASLIPNSTLTSDALRSSTELRIALALGTICLKALSSVRPALTTPPASVAQCS